MAQKCGVCHVVDSKYKCPVCELRYCSLPCYKTHKSTHNNEAETTTDEASQPKRDRPGTTQRVPKRDFTGFEKDEDFQRLLLRYPSLKMQLQTIYGLTLEPGPDEARTWNRQPLPGFTQPGPVNHGGRARSRGRGNYSQRVARGGFQSQSEEREHGPWTQAKGDKEALAVIKATRQRENDEAGEGMKEFLELCCMKLGDGADGS